MLTRIRQLSRSLAAQPLDQTEQTYVQKVLNPRQAQLFFQLAVFEQRHALRVCRTLCEGGFGHDQELLQAALLHDLGKHDPATGRHIPLWGKVANVVIRQVAGQKAVRRLAKPNPASGWRYVFWLQARHEKRGARLALTAQSSKRVAALIGQCQTLKLRRDPAALALSWADDLN